MPEYTQYVDEKYAAEIMAETESVAEDDLPSTACARDLLRKTLRNAVPEPAMTESGH